MTTVESNDSVLFMAIEDAYKMVGAEAFWHELDQTSFKSYGAKTSTESRAVMKGDRQKRKGGITDIEASAGFNFDLTFGNFQKILQGFCFAFYREKRGTKPLNTAQVPITDVLAETKKITATAGLSGFIAGNIVLASGFGVSANNGLKTAVSSTATELVFSETMVDETPSTGAYVKAVGHRFATTTMDIAMNGSLVQLNRASGTFDNTTLGLIPGEWIYLGSDASGNRFTTNVGFARISSITASTIEFDKVTWASPVVEAGTGKSIHIYFGDVIKNEASKALRKTFSYTFQRSLGDEYEYVVGAVPNDLSITFPQTGKVTFDADYVAADGSYDSTAKSDTGVAVNMGDWSELNSSSDLKFARVNLVSNDASPDALFASVRDLSITIKNGVSGNKRLASLGAFSTSQGDFDVSGKLTAYFSDTAAQQASRNNLDVTIDAIVVNDNRGFVIDIPVIGLGDAQLTVEKDKPVMVPLDIAATVSKFNHTLLVTNFPYLPTLADA